MNAAMAKLAMIESRRGLVQPSVCRLSHAVRPVLWLALLLALPCVGQNSSQQTPTGQISSHPLRAQPQPVDEPLSGENVANPLFYEERRLRQLNEAQHKSMVSDTDKLLRLATELTAEINSTNPTSLNSDQLRKVAEIEKLARSVKDKMRISLKGTPVYLDAAPPTPSPYPPH
ncbi:MAG TPA: hypothetical protein VGT08_15515 [Terracidiphilus sp.]|nr:hypothetical protein [Terracidiphilus sp.]